MKNLRFCVLAVLTAVTMVLLQATALSQTTDGNMATLTGGGAGARWDVRGANSGMTLIISAPDGRSFRTDYKAGTTPQISLSDSRFEGLPDGTYSYELRLRPVLSAAAKEAMAKARGKDDDPEAERAARKRAGVPSLVQTGSFVILNGSIIVPGGVEGQESTAKKSVQPRMPASTFGNTFSRLRNHRMYFGARPDDVVPDDQIVQGSECVGLDCVNGEVFNFDTVRLKENNTRIGFMDTSTSAGFPTNDWTIRANNSNSGGGSFLAFVDQGSAGTGSEAGTIIFEVDAGAPANSLRVASSGKVGLRTGTPVLDLHITTSDTPAHRLEQTNAGGFSAQTWDIAGNEANFFVRDVTGGSLLPFRIRPGAPTSSIDIAASGNVGIGTTGPTSLLHVSKNQNANTVAEVSNTTDGTGGRASLVATGNGGIVGAEAIAPGFTTITGWANSGVFFSTYPQMNLLNTSASGVIRFSTGGLDINANEKMRINSSGNVGIGTTAPTQLLSVNGTAGKPGGGEWDTFSDERLKNIKGLYHTGLKAVMQLQPIRYEYKPDNPLGIKLEGENIGFGAQSLEKIIPEAVTQNSAGYLMVKSGPILWTMLNAIKEQQKEIAELKAQVRKLQATSRRRRR